MTHLPSALELTRSQYSGWACVWCGASLARGGVSVGRVQGSIGAHDLSVEVYACSLDCPGRGPADLPGGAR